MKADFKNNRISRNGKVIVAFKNTAPIVAG